MKRLSRLLMAVMLALSFNAAMALAQSDTGPFYQDPGSGDGGGGGTVCRGWVWGPLHPDGQQWQCVPGALDCDC